VAIRVDRTYAKTVEATTIPESGAQLAYLILSTKALPIIKQYISHNVSTVCEYRPMPDYTTRSSWNYTLKCVV